MVCALCLNEAELRESHIIPEFMYQSLYDDIHRLNILSKEKAERNRKVQKGLREKLLCQDCEQRLGRHERYVSLLFGGGLNLEYGSHGRMVIVRGVDYKALRLFQLSILWRAGVTSLPFFEQVRLGPHQERLRQLLLKEDTGIPWQYGCLMFALTHEDQVQEDLIVQPTWTRIDGIFGYRFVFGGFVWVYIVGNHQTAKRLETESLHPSGELRILKSELADATFISDFGRILSEQGKLDAF
jgi:hypothetical protein